MRRDLPSLRLTVRCRLGDYKRTMMIKHILTICAAATAGVAAVSLAQAQQGYPVPPGSVYSSAPPSYPAAPQAYPSDYRRGGPGVPDYDATEDDEAPNSAALSPPGPMPQGPIMSPDDPRYGRPVYSDRSMPTGPILSPDDPRYGRPPGAPPVYSDRGAPTGPILSPDDPRYAHAADPPVIYANRPPGVSATPSDDNDGLRPPGAIGAPGNTTGSADAQQQPGQQPAVGPDGKPLTIAALPPEEQPESGPAQLPPNLRRQEVSFITKEPPGTIVVDTPNTYLYYVLGNGRAIRYGVRVGRDGFTWTGVQKITKKAEWPDWFPPSEMIERQPYLPRFMAGGPGNPLGARAMYLGSTVYRIHGTNQPSTIGKFVSSGCIGMLNEDVTDLFDRVKVGTRVVVLPGGPPPAALASAADAPVAGPSAGGPPPAQMSGTAAPGMPPTVVPPLPAPVTVR
jgi:lipoprotein-anchoring transpeptidase ErfK/SrfK